MINNTELNGATVFAPNVVGAGDCPGAAHFDLAHHLPGRLRFRSALLKGNARASEETQRHLAEISGVTSAMANPATWSVLLEYDPDVISPDKVSDVLAAHGYVLRSTGAKPEAENRWADKLARAVQDNLINALVVRLALALISALS
jgi:cation transport ATPase